MPTGKPPINQHGEQTHMAFTAALVRLDRKIPLSRFVDLGHTSGLGHEIVNTGTEMLAGYGLGRLHGHYREKAEVKGMPANLLTGIVAKGAAVVGSIMTKGQGFFGMSTLSAVGSAGFTTWAFTHGVKHGTDTAPTKVHGLHGRSVVGAIPPAPSPGVFVDPLNADELINLASQR